MKESEQIEILVDDVGKMLVQCEFISVADLNSNILRNQQEKAQMKEAGLRKDSGGFTFNFPVISALSGLRASPTQNE